VLREQKIGNISGLHAAENRLGAKAGGTPAYRETVLLLVFQEGQLRFEERLNAKA